MDTWVARTANEYTEAIAGELPTGVAWPRDADSGLMKWVAGCAQIWGDVDSRAATLLVQESDPRLTIEMLTDWETAFGLPDPCVTEPLTIEARRAALLNKITIQGAQSRAFFIAAAATLGYTITIYEYAPYTCGISRCGETRADGTLTTTYAHCGVAQCGVDRQGVTVETGGDEWFWQLGAPELRYYWKVKVYNTRLSWLRCGSGICGQDYMCEIGFASDLECLIRRWAPAHTLVIFDYSHADTSGVPTPGGGLDFSNSMNSGFLPAL